MSRQRYPAKDLYINYLYKKPYIARYARLFCLAHSKENPAQSVQVIYIQFLTQKTQAGEV